jgi:hypothetical protein
MRCRLPGAGARIGRRTDHLVREVGSLVVGEPGAGQDVEIGPLVSKAHFDPVCGFLDRARAQGIRAAVGGTAIPGPGYFVAPTVLTDVPDGAECSREEIFGPVITIETFTDESDAIDRANAVPYGLAASVWTENARRGHDLPSRLDFGTVWVNAHLGAGQRGALGRIQRIRIRPRPIHLRPRRLLPHQTRHAQPQPRDVGGGEDDAAVGAGEVVVGDIPRPAGLLESRTRGARNRRLRTLHEPHSPSATPAARAVLIASAPNTDANPTLSWSLRIA